MFKTLSKNCPNPLHRPFENAKKRPPFSLLTIYHRLQFTTKFSPIMIGLYCSRDAIVSLRGGTLSAHSVRPRKIQWRTIKTIACFCLGTIGLIVAPWKFDVLKTSIFALEAIASRANICFKNIKFPRGNYQPIVPRRKHSIV